MQTTKINHLESLCVIHADFDIWSGQTRLITEDIVIGQGGKLPSGKVAKLGSKHVCDPAALKGFQRLKTETRRLMLRHGMPFMNGFAVPVSSADGILAELDRISDEFDRLKQDFLHGYHHAVESWIQENLDDGDVIRQGVMPVGAVEKRLGFEYQVFMIQPVEDGKAIASLSKKVEGLGGDLLDEVADEATKFFSRNLSGRTECGVTTRNTLARIRDKIDGLSFLNNSFIPLVDLLDETVSGYDSNADGRVIRAPFFYQILAATLILSDRKRIEEYVNGDITVDGLAQHYTPGDDEASAKPVKLSRKDLSAAPVQQPFQDDGQAETQSQSSDLKGDEPQTALPLSDIQPSVAETVANEQSSEPRQVSQEELDALDDDLNRFFGGNATAVDAQASDALDQTPEKVTEESPVITEAVEIRPAADVNNSEAFPEMPEMDDEDCFF